MECIVLEHPCFLKLFWFRNADLAIVAGAHDFNNPASSQQSVDVVSIVIHPNYGNSTNDIAILKLKEPIKFTSAIQPVCLPVAGDKNSWPDGTMAVVAGWGRTVGKPSLND